MNPTEQLSGEVQLAPIVIEGVNGAETLELAGTSGRFGDTLQDAVFSFDEATGQVRVTARFGMGNLASAAASGISSNSGSAVTKSSST